MPDALIGHTGFVGGNLARQREFDALYNASNIDSIRGHSFGTVVCAAAPGAKWYANAHPQEDWATISRLLEAVHDIKAERFVLISTVDVFAHPRGVNEESKPTTEGLCWYGVNRLMLETRIAEQFEGRVTTIVRLPALFGPGLKKNALYDLMHNHETEKIAPNAVYQWYPLRRIADDIEAVVREGKTLVHFGSASIPMERLRRRFFPSAKLGPSRPDAPRYDVRSKYRGFWRSASEITREMEMFLAESVQQPH